MCHNSNCFFLSLNGPEMWWKRLERPSLPKHCRPSHFCASSGKPGSSACWGDSGGPLVREIQAGLQYELAGVMSLGSRDCDSVHIPLLFTRVEGEVNTWIRRELTQKKKPVRPAEKYED